MIKIAEFEVDGIGGNGDKPSANHGKFVGYVNSNSPSKFTPKKQSLNIDWSKVAEMEKEHNEKLAQMESGKSYWSE